MSANESTVLTTDTKHILAIDLGTSGPKVALFTMAGKYVDGDFTPVEMKLLTDEFLELLLETPGETPQGRKGRREDD